MNITLRRATPDDALALARAHVAAWHTAYRGIVPDAHLERITVENRAERFRQSLTTTAGEIYVAEMDGQIIGHLTLGGCRDTDVDRSTTGEIWGIYLSPEHWHKGIGTFLFKQGERMLATRGYSIVTLWVLEANDPARRFYEAMGFQTDGATRTVQLGVPLMAVRYRKKVQDIESHAPADAQ